MKRIIKELYKSGETRRDVLLYEAEFISLTSKEKQNTLISKFRTIKRNNEEFANRTIKRFGF